MPDVVCIGEPLIGMYGRSEAPLHGEFHFQRTFGGDTSNCALALAKLGCSVGYITRIGNDGFGQSFQKVWQEAGVDTSQVIVDPDDPTGLYFSASADSHHDFAYYRANSAASKMRPADISESYLATAKLLHVSGISQAISTSAAETIFHALYLAKKHGLLISYDVNYRSALWPSNLASAICRYTTDEFADILFVTAEELPLLTPHLEWEEASNRLLDGPKPMLIAIKLGENGCILKTTAQTVVAPAYKVPVTDTVGAGDAFAAALIAGTLEGMSLAELAKFATAAAALTCRGVGSVETQPTRREVVNLIG